ncbi:Proteophosphoglycan 5 [Rhodotorula toruloides ATCC 204091]|uniref:Proteophosphoglycan 5 n=1 Tax=Rhodotorula toruloides TaxID=5286 RepID=A0A0K3CC09_RHOTO|nr:Proteophosphoglycan 5 [Rhodotorula toruloides ATCC 204091]KAK4334784.1 Proteophosphoglycan 5 [Rhodotorula toruloides]PRQ76181.1 Proteophosphoglycan 5 [Rhodotorula toruloides]
MSDLYAAAVSQAYDHTGLVSQSDAYPPVSVSLPVDQHLHAGLVATSPPYHSSYSSTLAPPPHPSFYRQDSYATNSSGGTSSSSGSTLSSTPSDSLFYPPQASYETYPAPTPYAPTSTPFVPPTPAPAPPSASHLLQQHQANQQAFRLSQATSAPLVFGKYAAPAGQGAAGASGPDSPSSSTSDATATSSSQAGPSKSPISSHSNPSAGADGDFTQTFYDPFKVKHRRRTSAQQLKVLEHHFEINPKPDLATRKKLSEVLEMTPREVQVWFQNRRAKVKKLKERADREAALSAATAAASATASSSSLSSSSSDPTAYQPLPPPPPPAHGSPQARTIYGSDVLAARRGSSPAMFSGLTAPSSSSSSLPLESFVPTATSQPFLPLPPPPNGFAHSGASAYPSPVSLGVQSATPSPNDFLAHPSASAGMAGMGMAGWAVQGGYLDAVPSHSHVGGGGAGRRFSLPATHTSYPHLPPPSHSHPYAPPHDSTPTQAAYYPSIPVRPATATDPSVSPSSASSLSVEQGGWDQAGQVYAVDPHQQQSQLYAPPPPQAPQQASYAPAPDAGSYAPPPQQPQAGWADYSLTAAQVDAYGYSAQSTATRRGSMVAGMAVIAEHHQQHQHAQQYHAEAVVGRPPSGGSGEA